MKYLLVPLMLALYVPSAHSWGNLGHQTIGEIAERNLTPKAKTAITNILGPEKLAVTAVWADYIKDDPDFDGFKEYHYVDVPNKTVFEKIPVTDRAAKDAMTVLMKYPDMLKSASTERSVKMIALRYIVHVVGDVHQPLHVGNSMDSGGNFCKVTWEKKQVLNLHQIWDGRIIEYDVNKLKVKRSPLKDYNAVAYADDILKNNEVSASDISLIQAAPLEKWLKESQDLRPQIYPDEVPLADEAKRNYCNRSNHFPVISDDYKQKAAKISEARILYAGLRLAAMLNEIFSEGNNPGKNDDLSKEQIIDKLSLTNY